MTLPRRKIRLRGTGFKAEDAADVRDCLRGGLWVLGPPDMIGLKSTFDWHQAWEQFGAEVLADSVAIGDGTRPVAMYVLDLLPCGPSPAVEEKYWAGFYVEQDDRKVFYPYRETPRRECEAERLHAAGVIDKAELRRHRAGAYHKAHCHRG